MSAKTTFEPYKQDESDQKHRLNEPVLASFPQHLPPNLDKMKFSIYEHPSSAKSGSSKKKRVVKARGKNISYTASSTSIASSTRNQCMDYYIGVQSKKNDGTIYTMPVAVPFQFIQDIDGFQE
jgi:hypothetical protein